MHATKVDEQDIHEIYRLTIGVVIDIYLDEDYVVHFIGEFLELKD
jgi:hypothetical protein